MTREKLWLSILLGCVFFGGTISLVIWNESKPQDPVEIVTNPATTDATYTLSEISEHGDETSCWTLIDGNVYDLTEYIDKHPGGSKAILGVCGSEGTGSFNSMPAAVMSAAKIALAKYKIGSLSE